MKLCFIANADSIHSFKWIKYFADKGHEVHWISLTKNEFEEIENVKFYLLNQFSFKPFSVLFNLAKIKSLMSEINPDILHVHYIGVNGILGSFANFKPFILTAWGSDILFAGKSRIMGPFVRNSLRKADLITCDADHMKDSIIKLGAKEEDIEIVYFGIDVNRFMPERKDQEVMNNLGLNDSGVVISLRSLESIYDIETLIRAVPLVLNEIPNVKFLIAGRGSQEESLKEMVSKMQIEKSVKFIGFIKNTDLVKYINLSDAYVSTSLSDGGIASSTAEAMACSIPVIISSFGENYKWIKNEESGFLFSPGNYHELAEKIIFVLKNKEKSKELGLNARKVIEERNNYYKEMGRMENFYEEIIKKN